MPDIRACLLPRRVPIDEIVLGRAYIINARNGGVGIAVIGWEELLCYRLHRVKFERHFLFDEIDWEASKHGTAIPLRLFEDRPPDGDEALLAWLADREVENKVEIDAAWDEVLGKPDRSS